MRPPAASAAGTKRRATRLRPATRRCARRSRRRRDARRWAEDRRRRGWRAAGNFRRRPDRCPGRARIAATRRPRARPAAGAARPKRSLAYRSPAMTSNQGSRRPRIEGRGWREPCQFRGASARRGASRALTSPPRRGFQPFAWRLCAPRTDPCDDAPRVENDEQIARRRQRRRDASSLRLGSGSSPGGASRSLP